MKTCSKCQVCISEHRKLAMTSGRSIQVLKHFTERERERERKREREREREREIKRVRES